MQEKSREINARRYAARLGLELHKSKCRLWSVDNQLGYRIVDPYRNTIIHGERYELTLEGVEGLLQVYEDLLRQGQLPAAPGRPVVRGILVGKR